MLLDKKTDLHFQRGAVPARPELKAKGRILFTSATSSASPR